MTSVTLLRSMLIRDAPRPARDRARSGLLAAVIAFLGFVAVFGAVKARRAEPIDLAITLRMQARRHPALGKAMEAVSWPGFPPQSRIIPPLLMVGMLALNLRVEAAFQLLAWGTAGLSEWLKGLTSRQRPMPEQVRVVVAPLGGTSFPSGHVITYVGTYGFFAFLVHSLLRIDPLRRLIVGALLLLLAAVGPSRIYQGHHWPTDVAASYLLGTSYVIVLAALYRRVRNA